MTSANDITADTESTDDPGDEVQELDTRALDSDDEGADESAGIDATMEINWSFGAENTSNEAAIVVARKFADVVLLLLISVAIAVAITVTFVIGASWGWNFVWNAIRG